MVPIVELDDRGAATHAVLQELLAGLALGDVESTLHYGRDVACDAMRAAVERELVVAPLLSVGVSPRALGRRARRPLGGRARGKRGTHHDDEAELPNAAFCGHGVLLFLLGCTNVYYIIILLLRKYLVVGTDP